MIFDSQDGGCNQDGNADIICPSIPTWKGLVTDAGHAFHGCEICKIGKDVPYGTASHTLQGGKQKERANQFLCPCRNFITGTSRVPVYSDCKDEKESEDVSPYITGFVVDLGDTVYTLHFILIKAIATENEGVSAPVRWDFLDC